MSPWRRCWSQAGPEHQAFARPGRYLYFAIADDFVYFDAPVTVDISVEFLQRSGSSAAAGELTLEYDSYQPGREAILADRYRAVHVAALGSTGELRSATGS